MNLTLIAKGSLLKLHQGEENLVEYEMRKKKKKINAYRIWKDNLCLCWSKVALASREAAAMQTHLLSSTQLSLTTSQPPAPTEPASALPGGQGPRHATTAPGARKQARR